ncbi:MAG: DUF4856 domain-containing protein [Flavobacteriaceae bacterium]|nr:DUF4856 domain-containing protein [Flavobacteriaceae bacterium]
MKRLILIMFLGIIYSCNSDPEQTVETAYVNPAFLPDNLKYKVPVNEIMLRYKFSRNGISNVDYLECSLLREPLNIVERNLDRTQIFNDYNYNSLMNYYKEGIYHIKPEKEVATSKISESYRDKIKADILSMINKSAEISGYQTSDPASHRNRIAKPNRTGYIGYSAGDPNVAFVDEKGVIVSEVFKGMIIGAIYLDKILNEHLDERYFDDENLRKDHENVVLPEGRNYTELEHHWDLAYGYFQFLKSLPQANGVPVLKYSEQKLYGAFVQGRIELNRYRYDDMKVQLKIIREELSRVVAIRIIDYLIGVNTIVNLKEDNGSDAFMFLSKAYGLIYALQFTRNAEGNKYFTYEQIQDILNQFRGGNGFWDTERLLGDESVNGSVENIANQIAEPFGFSVEEVKR